MTSSEKPSASSSQSCCSSDYLCLCSGRSVPTTDEPALSGAADLVLEPTTENVSLDELYPAVRALTIHPDSRGNVRETYRASWFPMVPPVKQLVRSESLPKTLRGLHLHKYQWDIWHFVSGSALVRLRTAEGVDAFERFDAGSVLAIPPNVSHGFYTEEGCILLYALTEEYDGSDEYGWWPFSGLTEDSHPGWPRDHIGLIISERDLRAPKLEDFEW